MEDNVQEMYERARKAFKEIEFWPQEKVDEMVEAVAWEFLKEDVRHKLGYMAVEESDIGNAEDKKNKIKNKTLGTLYDMRDAKTCGMIEEDKALGIRKYAKPIGVIANAFAGSLVSPAHSACATKPISFFTAWRNRVRRGSSTSFR